MKSNNKFDTIDLIRLQNARWLASTEKSQVVFGAKIGADASRTSQIIGKKPSRNIGDDAARQIEEAYGKPVGWLDHDHNQAVDTGSDKVAITAPDETSGAAMLVELINLYMQSTPDGRLNILDGAREAKKL